MELMQGSSSSVPSVKVPRAPTTVMLPNDGRMHTWVAVGQTVQENGSGYSFLSSTKAENMHAIIYLLSVLVLNTSKENGQFPKDWNILIIVRTYINNCVNWLLCWDHAKKC